MVGTNPNDTGHLSRIQSPGERVSVEWRIFARLPNERTCCRPKRRAGPRLTTLEQRLALASRTLDAVSPLATLGRGFAVVSRDADGTLLRDAAQVSVGEQIEARLAKGRLRAQVVSTIRDDND